MRFKADKCPSPGTWPPEFCLVEPVGPVTSCVPLYAGKLAHKPKELASVSQGAVSGPWIGGW